MLNQKLCAHLQELAPKAADRYVCDECVKTGSRWVHLRMCQECGGVHCCDNSPNKHATKHYQSTGHPVVTSAEPGESWAWCYHDGLYMEY
jgi:uncharacterized UBP type Zn finger protein